jgi:methanogen homoaconitase small subunit
VAKSFARIFYRNAINVGLPLVEAEAVCSPGEEIEIDLSAGTITSKAGSFQGTRMPEFLMEILKSGGLVAHRRREKR